MLSEQVLDAAVGDGQRRLVRLFEDEARADCSGAGCSGRLATTLRNPRVYLSYEDAGRVALSSREKRGEGWWG